MKSLILLGLLMAAPAPQEQIGCCPHSSHARPDYTARRRKSTSEREKERKGKPDRNKDDK